MLMWRMAKRKLKAGPIKYSLLILVSTYAIFMLVWGQPSSESVVQEVNISVIENLVERLEVWEPKFVFVVVVCQGQADNDQGGSIGSDIQRQIRQTSVMLKSAVALTSTTIKVVIVADSPEWYSQIVNFMSSWPEYYSSKMILEYKPVWYPPGLESTKTLFRVCTTERLSVPDLVPHLDTVVYIDTDFIFFRPPEDLWKFYEDFDDKQLMGIAPCLNHYGSSKNKVPYYGTTGLNAGVLVMNLTRIKNFPNGGWVPSIMKVYKEYKEDLKLADQDILNVLFNKHPELLYEMGCEWNYRPWVCSRGVNKCPEAEINGVSLLHGNALSFASNTEMKLQVIFEAWEKHKLGTSLKLLLKNMEDELKKVSIEKLPSKCARVKNIDDILLNEFRNTVL